MEKFMKKSINKLFVKISLCAITLLTFAGCKEVTPEIDIYDKNYDHTYWVKINDSGFDIDAESTGYITSTTLREEFVEDFEETVPADVDFKAIYKQQKNDYLPMDNINNSILEEMKNASISSGRSSNTAPIPCEPTEDDYKVGDTKEIFVLLESEPTNIIEKYPAKCEYSSELCNIWFIDNCDYVKENDLLNLNGSNYFVDLAKKFEKAMELEESIVGPHIYTTKASEEYADPSKKVNLVVYDINNDAEPYWDFRIFGYTWYNDFFNNDSSNKGAYIYLDTHVASQLPNSIFSTILHEYNHYLVYANKCVKNNVYFQSWFTEMLSLTMEDIFLDYIGISRADSSEGRLPIFNQFYRSGFTNWRQGEESLASYASAYAFGAYLFRNFGGFDLLKQITQNEYTDEKCITEALKACNQTYIDENGVEQYVDYDYALENFYKVLINNKPATEVSDKNYITLNRQIGDLSDDLHFYAIDLYNLGMYNSDGSESKPVIFPATKEGQVAIGANGFSIHHVGAQLSTYKYVKPSVNSIKSIFFSTRWNDILK